MSEVHALYTNFLLLFLKPLNNTAELLGKTAGCKTSDRNLCTNLVVEDRKLWTNLVVEDRKLWPNLIVEDKPDEPYLRHDESSDRDTLVA